MISSFQISVPKKVVFGRGEAREKIGDIASYGRKLLVVHGSNRDRVSWLIDALQSAGITVATTACDGEPDLATVEAAVL